MQTKHTPGPWFAKREGFSTIYIESRLRAGILQEVAACGPTEAGPEQQEANAAFIVRACNSHNQLVTALQDAIEIIRAIDQTDNTCEKRIDVSGFRAALAAAGAA